METNAIKENKPRRIVLVDDNRYPTVYYRQELEIAGYEVLQYSSLADVKPLLDKPEQIDFFILDIMMPSEPLYSDERTENGLFTGLFLAQDIRELYPQAPIVLLSAATFERSRHAAEVLITRLSDCILLQKMDTPPDRLVGIVDRYFRELKLRPAPKRTILQRLFGSLLLQPNISGVGIDLKKLGEDE